eukprot:UN2960
MMTLAIDIWSPRAGWATSASLPYIEISDTDLQGLRSIIPCQIHVLSRAPILCHCPSPLLPVSCVVGNQILVLLASDRLGSVTTMPTFMW